MQRTASIFPPKAATLLLLWLGLAGSPQAADAPPQRAAAAPAAPPRSVILIVNDTMRRDHLGVFGGPAGTPSFDAFAGANLLFEQAYSQSPWTKPSVATLLTSLYPSQHRVLSHPKESPVPGASNEAVAVVDTDILAAGFTTLAESLQAAGLRTAGFVGNPWMGERFGFSQGFNTYDDSFADWTVTGDVISDAALAWLSRLKPGDPFFLYIHYMDSHRPYGRLTPEDVEQASSDTRQLDPVTSATIAYNITLQDGRKVIQAKLRPSITLLERAYVRGVESFDRALGRFLDGFARHEAYGRTAIVVTSDHGEALYSRGYGNHGNGLYEDEIAIPFAARFPGVPKERFRLREPVGLIDVVPTLCAWAGAAPPPQTFGRNLLDVASGELSRRYLVTEGVIARPNNRTVRYGDYKLLWQPQEGPAGRQHLLFRVVQDPEESHDLLAPDRRTAATKTMVQEFLDRARLEVPGVDAPREQAPIDPEVLERLRSLGYVE